jgi:hypothetical protein
MRFNTFTVKPLMILWGILFIIAMATGHFVWALVYVGLAVWGPEIEFTWRRKPDYRADAMARSEWPRLRPSDFGMMNHGPELDGYCGDPNCQCMRNN